ncbi:MAG: arginase family protein [Candidatus Melainabacteria bacterium]|nr:arginase family protein [Candidatus Melainabacteria bacterium]
MKKNISIILAPFSIGGPNNAAKDGPQALMSNNVDDDLKELGFNVKIIRPPKNLGTLAHKHINTLTHKHISTIKNIDSIVKINNWLSTTIASEIKNDSIPLTIGGDHSLAIGTITGTSDALGNIGVLWIDRHFDAHSPKNTPSWRAHGMPVAVLAANKNYDLHPDFQNLLSIGKSNRLPKVKPENFVQIAIGEKSHIKPNTKWYSMEYIDNVGIKKVIDEALNYLLKRVKHVYIAWDIDSMNVTGTGTSGDSQLTLREGLVIAREINKKIRLANRLAGFEIMEVAPKLERKDLRGQTVDWAIQLVTTCFGGNLFNNLSRLKRNIHV